MSYAGSPTAIAASSEVRVLVRRGVVLLGPGPATTRTATAGRSVTLTWTPSGGRYYWRVAVPPTVEFANNLSAAYRWSISR